MTTRELRPTALVRLSLDAVRELNRRALAEGRSIAALVDALVGVAPPPHYRSRRRISTPRQTIHGTPK
jgi:hypothetical protein